MAKIFYGKGIQGQRQALARRAKRGGDQAMTMTVEHMSRAEVETALQHEIAVSKEYGFVIVDLRTENKRLLEENARLTTELRLVRQYARDTLAAIDDSPARTLLKAAIFE